MSKQCNNKEFRFEDHFFGSVTVGERGQVVIPAEARKRYRIETGDKLLVLGTPHDKGIMICKIDDIRQFMTLFLENLDTFEDHVAHEEGDVDH
jgi:AbrB family looped-hinge helix DNA binding protein